MRVLVDTNVFMDFFYRTDENNSVRAFFEKLFEGNNELYVSALTFRDFEYLSHKYTHDRKETKKALFAMYRIVNKIADLTADSVIDSLFDDGKDFEDNLQIHCAADSMCDAIITSNVKDFAESEIPVMTPEQFAKHFKTEVIL